MGIDFKGSVPTFAALPSTGLAEGHAYIVADEADKLVVWDADTSSWVDGGSIQGPPGPAGAPGDPGPRGSGWFVGSGAPGSIPGALVGDLYLDLLSGEVHQLQPPPSGFSIGDLPAIGAAFQGGFYGGLISQAANGIASHALIIAPKSTG